MKQKLILSLLAIASGVLSVSAQNEEKITINAGNMAHIFIANDMDVVLMPGSVYNKSVSMNAEASSKVNLKFSNTKMTISSRRATKDKLTVYLYVNDLKTITAGNSTSIKTLGVLNSTALDVFIEGDAMAHVKSRGSIRAHSVNDGEIDVTYKEAAWWQRID